MPSRFLVRRATAIIVGAKYTVRDGNISMIITISHSPNLNGMLSSREINALSPDYTQGFGTNQPPVIFSGLVVPAQYAIFGKVFLCGFNIIKRRVKWVL